MFNEKTGREEDGNGTNGTIGSNGTNEDEQVGREGQFRNGSETEDCDKVDRQLGIHQNNYTDFTLFDRVVFIQIKGK